MPAWFYNLHVASALFLVYFVFGGIGFIAYKINKKYFKQDSNSTIVSAAQQTGLTFGTIFIAFWIALNWQSLDSLTLASKSEAQSILDLYSNSHSVDDKVQAANVRIAIVNYIDSIISEEYKSLEQGEINAHTEQLFSKLKLTIYSLPTHNLEEKITYHQLTQSLNGLADFRDKRLDYVDGQMNGILLLFFVLLLVIICFWSACLMHTNRKLVLSVILCQYLIILTSAWLILEIDRPFQGYFKVDNSAFVQARSEIELLHY